jgi:iron(III) transport system permease protein
MRIHSELEQAASVSGANIKIASSHRCAVAHSLADVGMVVHLPDRREMSLPLLLAGPSSQTISVAMFDLWANSQAASRRGLMWVTFMTIVATIFYRVARRLSLTSFGH